MQQILAIWDRTSFHFTRWFYLVVMVAATLFALSYFADALYTIAVALLLFTGLSVFADAFLLYRKKGMQGERIVKERLSNGDDNRIVLLLRNRYEYKINCTVIEEVPYQFQIRNWKRRIQINANSEFQLTYELRPVERGLYHFGHINVFVKGILGLVNRRYILGEEQEVKVYPSYVQMRKYQLIAAGAQFQDVGVKRMRKLGHSMEFEQIKEYVRGDDYRTINWKATARRGDLMVNSYTDEKSQQIYCVINKGRVMKMPFDGMTLLDYAINASLVISNVALQKQDRAGLICFSQQVDVFLQAERKPTQINHILESLYNQQTDFMEPDSEKLFSAVRNRITQRSLLLFFTNFESIESLERELPSLKRLAHYHLLVVVFFENTELRALTEAPAHTIEDIYIKTIAEKYRQEKLLIAKELQRHGIISVLSQPQHLTINTLNKYLELKDRSSI